MRIAACLALSALLVPGIAFAQEVVGTGFVDGRKVELRSDNTWAFADKPVLSLPGSEDCLPINGSYEFCGKDLGWRVAQKIAIDAAASFSLNDRTYGLVITEALGVQDGMSLDFMAGAVISNAAVALNIRDEDITIFSTTDGQMFGDPSREMAYGADVDGLRFVYFNTLVVRETETLQFLMFSIGPEPTDTMREANSDFIAAMKERGS